MLDFETFNVLVGTHVSALLAEHGAVPLEVVEVKKLSDKTGSMSAATTVDRSAPGTLGSTAETLAGSVATAPSCGVAPTVVDWPASSCWAKVVANP